MVTLQLLLSYRVIGIYLYYHFYHPYSFFWTIWLILCLISQVPSEASSSQQQVPPAFKNFSMSQKEETLDELVKDAWLCRTGGGYIGLNTKSLLDLRSCFRNYEVPSCEVCNEADGVKVCILKL